MSATIHSLPRRGANGPIDGGGSGGDDGDMETRIQALEAAQIETRDRLARIETRLDSTATKTDLHEVRAALHEVRAAMLQEINSQTWKLVTFVCGFGTALVTATYFLAKHV